MTSKSDKGKKPTGKIEKHAADPADKKTSSKSKKQMEEEDDDDELGDDEEMKTKSSVKKAGKATSSKKDEDDDDESDVEEEKDDWEKPEVEEEWDPDFDEFDVPKSKAKKVPGGKKATEEEDLKIDDEFKEMGLFDESFDDEEEDDY